MASIKRSELDSLRMQAESAQLFEKRLATQKLWSEIWFNELSESRREAANLSQWVQDLGSDLIRERQERIHLEGENITLAGWYVSAKHQLNAEKDISQSLQEKLTISIENEAQLRKEIERLQKTGTTLASYILVQIANELPYATVCYTEKAEPSEQITPPPCLKPLDAMKWNEQVVSGSITYRG